MQTSHTFQLQHAGSEHKWRVSLEHLGTLSLLSTRFFSAKSIALGARAALGAQFIVASSSQFPYVSMSNKVTPCCPMLFHFSETKAEVKCERLRCRCFLTELVRAVQVNVLSCDAIEKQKGTPAENCRSSTHVMKCNGSPSSSPTRTSPNSPRRQCFAS